MSVGRPAFNPAGLHMEVARFAEQKAARSWCYVAPHGGTFYVTETKAKAMQAANGGTVYPPVAA